MPVELRKRKAPAAPPPPPRKKKASTATSKAAKAADKAKEAAAEEAKDVKKEAEAKTNGAAAAAKSPEVGSVIDLEGFGGDIETNDGKKTTLKALVDESKAGVVLFTYPKASTPGCKRPICFAGVRCCAANGVDGAPKSMCAAMRT